MKKHCKLLLITLAVIALCGLVCCKIDDDVKQHTINAREMVLLSAGTFTRGSPDTEAGRLPFDRYSGGEDQVEVTLTEGFWIGKYQITQPLYLEVMGANTDGISLNPSGFTAAPSGENTDYLPVERVSWFDALVFCNRYSIADGLSPAYSISGSTDPDVWIASNGGNIPSGSNAAWEDAEIVAGSTGYRLPTEAQWEYACRAGTGTPFNTGNDPGIAAWYGANSDYITHAVGLKTTNDWGLYDMHGNVFEWCWDRWGDYTTYSIPQIDPQGAAKGSGEYAHRRVVRGGGYASTDRRSRSAHRTCNDPWTSSKNDQGFRVIRPE